MLWIVIATYNEIESLPKLAGELFDKLPEARILVVDDDSPDGTGEWCRDFSQRDSRLQCWVRRQERGLGSAALCGLRKSLEAGATWIATIDADGSHPAGTLKEMYQAALENSADRSAPPIDLMIGSRYVPGGEIVGWPWHRRAASWLINGLVRWGLGLSTRDNSSGLRIYRAETLRRLDLSAIRSSGYAYLEEILYRLAQSRAVIREWPITFRDRQAGTSKATWREAREIVCRILLLRLGR